MSNDNDSSKISRCFAELRPKGEAALITYAMAGFPTARASSDVISGMIRGGADIIEIGFPFSDPLADGPAIQEAGTISLGRGMTFERFLRYAKRTRRENPDTPLVLMTYANIIYKIGYEEAARQVAGAGIDGMILPDMPVDESSAYCKAARECGLDVIFLASPNTPAGRLRELACASSGFLYMVAVYGTTGVRGQQAAGSRRHNAEIPQYTTHAISRAKRAAGRLAVGVGFGVSGPADVAAYAKAGADAVIVGSAYTDIIKNAAGPSSIMHDVASFTRRLKAATRHIQ